MRKYCCPANAFFGHTHIFSILSQSLSSVVGPTNQAGWLAGCIRQVLKYKTWSLSAISSDVTIMFTSFFAEEIYFLTQNLFLALYKVPIQFVRSPTALVEGE